MRVTLPATLSSMMKFLRVSSLMTFTRAAMSMLLKFRVMKSCPTRSFLMSIWSAGAAGAGEASPWAWASAALRKRSPARSRAVGLFTINLREKRSASTNFIIQRLALPAPHHVDGDALLVFQSLVELEELGGVVHVHGVDLLDHVPVLDADPLVDASRHDLGDAEARSLAALHERERAGLGQDLVHVLRGLRDRLLVHHEPSFTDFPHASAER